MSSSESPKVSASLPPKKPEIDRYDLVIVGEVGDWTPLLAGYAAGLQGLNVKTILSETRRQSPFAVSHVGNGEIRENARLILGDDLANRLWSFSLANRERLSSLAREVSILDESGPLLWFAHGEREKKLAKASTGNYAELSSLADLLKQNELVFDSILKEPATLIDNVSWTKTLSSCQPPATHCRRVLSIERQKTMESRIVIEGEGGFSELSASLVVILSESIPSELFPSLRDKLIPVTLSSFEYQTTQKMPNMTYALFHMGADFSVKKGQRCFLGSFRNLFEDKAVGIHNKVDPRTKEGVKWYFASLGWIDEQEEPRPYVDVHAITCDGLPLVGSLPEHPGVYVVAGFAARRENYIFEVVHVLVNAIAGKADFDPLSPFSTKRFL